MPATETNSDEVLTPPDGLHFFAVAESLEELRSAVNADLHWRDSDGAHMLLSVERPGASGQWKFLISRAYNVIDRGKSRWVILDSKNAWDGDFQSAARQFYCIKFFHEDLVWPFGGSCDGNYSYAEPVGESSAGASVFKISYISSTAGRPHQEDCRAYLILVPKTGAPMLLAQQYGNEGTGPSAATGGRDWLHESVLWDERGELPAAVLVRQYSSESPCTEGAACYGSYTTYRDGLLHGSFPMRATWNDKLFLDEVNGNRYPTVSEVAKTLAGYHSGIFDWNKEHAERVIELWKEHLRRANGMQEDWESFPRRIVIPDLRATKAAIKGAIQPK